ncbi:hypothetical protein [Kribbella flavida]|nr:hypothetical protein [Kribbella flavida]
MYPADWPAVDGRERKAPRRRRPKYDAVRAETRAVQEAINRRDNGGEPKK